MKVLSSFTYLLFTEKIEITTTIKKKKRKLEAIDESVPKKSK